MIPTPEIEEEDTPLPEVPSRAEFTALIKRMRSLEASLQRRSVLRGQSGARKRRSKRHKPVEDFKANEEDPELPDYNEDEES